MKKNFLVFISFFALHTSLFSQDIFISKGQIEFEKRVNIYNALDDRRDDNDDRGGFDWISQIKKQLPEWNITYFNLFFDGDKTLYKPGKETTQNARIPDWFQDPAQNNTVYCDLKGDESISEKSVFESVFLITDSLRKINWKISNDTREIAGFKCRKATAIIMDSVYVIAFYTDQITTSGGPESFNSLPGMILGLAVPRLHTTWFATKVQLTDPSPADLAAPSKGKKANREEMVSKLKSTMKDWGKYGQHMQWEIEL